MSHLEVDQFVGILRGRGSEDERCHLEGCTLCRAELDTWRRRLPVLGDLLTGSLADTELHRLRVLFRQLGPAGRKNRRATLVKTSGPRPAAAMVAVRGTLAASLEEYEAGPWKIVLQVRPSDAEARFDVHGQMSSRDGASLPGGDVMVSSDDGHSLRTTLDGFGEFRFRGMPEGVYRATWVVGAERIEISGLEIGGGGD